jgi:hypothetical protein
VKDGLAAATTAVGKALDTFSRGTVAAGANRAAGVADAVTTEVSRGTRCAGIIAAAMGSGGTASRDIALSGGITASRDIIEDITALAVVVSALTRTSPITVAGTGDFDSAGVVVVAIGSSPFIAASMVARADLPTGAGAECHDWRCAAPTLGSTRCLRRPTPTKTAS